jgi:hypothetical protein
MAGPDPKVHKRFLDYRESHVYFARGEPCMDIESFTAADAELRALLAKEPRDDEEEARVEELEKLLYRD